jgi:hypothetical protein
MPLFVIGDLTENFIDPIVFDGGTYVSRLGGY